MDKKYKGGGFSGLFSKSFFKLIIMKNFKIITGKKLCFILALMFGMGLSAQAQKKPAKDAQAAKPAAPALSAAEVEKRVQDLLKKMSVEEKCGQMTQVDIHVILKDGETQVLSPEKLRMAIVTKMVGSVLNVADNAYSVEKFHEILKMIQDLATKETPNKIPVIYGIDAIHGATYTLGSTLFPQNIATAATRNTEFAKIAAEVTAKEIRASGLRWNFDPVLDVGRNPLWARFPETFGEDVYLCSAFGVATILGYEGNGDLSKIDRVASCMKHYLGYSNPLSGKDRTPSYIPERQLREYYLPPFKAAVDAGASTLMINSGEINGIPVHGNKYLLTDVLRGELGFKGLAVSDWEDVKRLHTRHKVAATPKEAVRMAVMAGVDMSMVPDDFSFYDLLVELVKEGAVPMSRIDEAVGRILTLKFRLGLFENAYPEKEAVAQFGKPEYRKASLEAAREAITLLKNNNNVLPLPKNKKVLVTGPAANSITALNGCWSYTWQGRDPQFYPKDAKTILDAVTAKVGASNVVHTKGAGFEGEDNDIRETVEAAKNVDYVILCIGEEAYAETPGDINDLDLPEIQIRLGKALIEAGKPVIIVLAEGRPRVFRQIEGGAAAVVMAYWPGIEGGPAIADILFGDVNPSGKLPFTYPKYSNDIQLYDRKLTEDVLETFPYTLSWTGYDPQYPFGHGLSYTTFEYSNLKLSSNTLKGNGTLTVSIDVKNTGQRAGKEAVELYTQDLFASITPSVKRLRKFNKISLNPGQTMTVKFELNKNDLAFIGLDSKTFVTEPGEFEVMIGDKKAIFVYEE